MSIASACPRCGAPLESPAASCRSCLLALAGESAPGQKLGPGFLDDLPLPKETVLIAGKYEILGTLARGGMGVVYRARSLDLKRTVALKMIRGGRLATADEMRRFQTEAEAAAHLDHANIVPIYEVGEHDGEPFFAMRLVEGASLAQRIAAGEFRITRENARAMQTRIAQLMARVAAAVHHAHQRGVLHRDLKPSNVLVDPSGEPHLTDFGLAKLTVESGSFTHSSDVLGTPQYMAPEQARGQAREATTATDVYGLGVILYELLTGQPPFTGSSIADLLRQIEEEEPRRPGDLNSFVDRDLATICLKCLEKECDRRYSSAAALGEELDRWLRGEPVWARPSGVMVRVTKWARRKPALAVLTAALGCAILAGLGTTLWQWRQARAGAEAVRTTLVRFYFENGARLMSEGRAAEALPWLAATLSVRSNDPPTLRLSRQQMGDALDSCHELVQMFFHDGEMQQGAFSPDGRHLATAHRDRTARLWDLASGQPASRLLKGDSPFVTPGLVGHTEYVSFDPSGRLLLASTSVSEAGLWRLDQPSPQARLLEGIKAVKLARFSPDGRRIATLDTGQQLRLWGADGSPTTSTLALGGEVGDVQFSPDSQRVAVGLGLGEVRLFAADSGALVRKLRAPEGDILHLAFSPDGRRIAAAGVGSFRVWDVATGTNVPLSWFGAVAYEMNSHHRWIEFSPDGQRIVVASQADGAQVWDLSFKAWQNPRIKSGTGCSQARFSPDGRWLALAWDDDTASVCDAVTGRRIGQEMRHGGRVTSVEWSRDGTMLLTTSEDHAARLWSIKLAPPGRTLGEWFEADWTEHIAFNADGSRFVTATRHGRFEIFQTTGGASQGVRSPPLNGVPIPHAAFSPDGLRLLTAHRDGDARLWSVETGRMEGTMNHADSGFANLVGDATKKTLKNFDGLLPFIRQVGEKGMESVEMPSNLDETLAQVAWSPDGRRIATAGRDGWVRFWNADASRAVVRSLSHSNAVVSIQYSPRGEWLATGSWDGTARIWETGTNSAVSPPLSHGGPVNWVCFSPNGQRLATASTDGTVRLWSVPDGAECVPPLRHRGGVNLVRFSPSGRRLVTGGDDGFARVWDAHSGGPFSLPLPVGNSVTVAEFLDERRLLLGDRGGSARIWDAEFHLPCSGPLEQRLACAAVGPDKKHIVTANLNRERHLHLVTEETRPTWLLCDLSALQSCQKLSLEERGLERLTPGDLQTLWSRLREQPDRGRPGR